MICCQDQMLLFHHSVLFLFLLIPSDWSARMWPGALSRSCIGGQTLFLVCFFFREGKVLLIGPHHTSHRLKRLRAKGGGGGPRKVTRTNEKERAK